MNKIIKNVVIFIIIFLAFMIFFSTNWLYNSFGNLSIDSILFQIKVPIEGTNSIFIYTYIKQVVLPSIIGTIIIYILTIIPMKNTNVTTNNKDTSKKITKIINRIISIKQKYATKLVAAIIILVISLSYVIVKMDIIKYIKDQFTESKFIENEYVDASNVEITFPEKKRNLIYIYLESMESTYYSKELGGFFDENLIPELSKLAQENISFSTKDKLEGSYVLATTGYTTAAMVAHTMGIPLLIPINGNTYGERVSFLPGACGIGEILENQGYNQMLMFGSDATFGGRKALFSQHGNYNIWDVNSAIEEGKIKQEDKVNWGIEDKDLIIYAKEKLSELANQDKPFSFTMLTVDTHHPNGWKCSDCESKFNNQYFDAIACSSKKITEFVKWIQNQPFYENTTIVISGDHLSMNVEDFEQINKSGYERRVINIFINSAVVPAYTKYRDNSTFDLFPTTLASIGAKIEGNRLGLGTNLFSDEDTLVKKYGLETVNEELRKSSSFYNNKFLYGKRK